MLLGSSSLVARAEDNGSVPGSGRSDASDGADAPALPSQASAPAPKAGPDQAAGRWDAVATATVAPDMPLRPADWAPEHAAGRISTARQADHRADTKSADPEPNAALQPSHPAPSGDPLDRSAAPPDGAAAAVTAPEPLPPLNAALKAALDAWEASALHGTDVSEQRKERSAIAFFYAARGFGPVWSKDGQPVAAVEGVLAQLAHAGDDALTLPNRPKGLQAQGALEAVARSELELTRAVVAYARQATGSRVDPRSIGPLIGYRPALADPAEILDAVAGAGREGGDKLKALNPDDPRYAALRDKLAGLAKGSLSSGGAPVAAGPTLHVGMHDDRVPALRARFGLAAGFGDDPDDERRYDAELADAVAAFQRENGLPPTGWLTKRTTAALSGAAKPSRLQGAVIANMEMWRWMPRDLAADRIEVNVPDYLVTVFHDGKPADQHRVVVGKPDTPTPLFANTMKYLIVNPYWNVPQSIIKKELLPKGGGSLAYLQSRGYSVSWHGGTATVKQLPGEKNALGRIKFLFPNDYSVYLHDTPSKSLFSANKRAFSHGCVRVDQPFGFAETVLNDASPDGSRKRWTEERLEDMIGDKEHYLNLPTPLPIEIEYFTASVDDGGRVKLREDIYGYTHAVASALGQDSDPPPKAVHEPEKALVASRSHRHALDQDADLDPEPEAPHYRARQAAAVRQRQRPLIDETATASMPAPAAPRGFWDSIFNPQ